MNDALLSEKKFNPLAQNFNVRSLLSFALPTIFMMIFMGLYTAVDAIFVSRYVNTDALSAINIVTPIIYLIVGFGTMLATGGSAIIAQKMSDGREQEARENFTLIILVSVVIGLLITFFGLIFIDPIIRTLGASDILFPYCKDYLTTLLIFTPISILQVVFGNLFVTAGKPGLGLFLVVLAGITNAILDYVFIVPFQMGIGGAALATSIGYMIPAITGIIFFTQNKGHLFFSKPKLDISVLTESCFNGSSEMVAQLSTAVTTFVFNAMMMKLLGEDGVAAITIILYSQFLLTALYIGFAMGVAPIISYNYNNVAQLKTIFRICMQFLVVTSLLTFAVSLIGGKYIVSLFAAPSTNIYTLAQNGFEFFSFSFLFCGINIFISALFTALSNGKVSAFLSFLRTFGFITVGLWVLPSFLHITGVWIAIPLAELLTLFLSIAVIFRYRKRYQYI